MTFDITRLHKNIISRSRFSQDFQDVDRIVADVPHLWSDSEPGEDTVGIYVENHEGKNRAWFNWIRFHFWNLDFRWLWPTCWRTFWFLKLDPWRRVLRTTCKGIRGHQGWYLTPRDFRKHDFKKWLSRPGGTGIRKASCKNSTPRHPVEQKTLPCTSSSFSKTRMNCPGHHHGLGGS